MAQMPPPPPQYGVRSPDGRWWWDGQAWQPVPEMQVAAVGPPPGGPLGKPRSVGVSILLAIVTIGIYAFYWVYKTQDEVKQHSGIGVGGGLGLVIFFFISPVTYFLVASDVAAMYQRRGWNSPVSTLTGLWFILPLLGSLIWFVKVQGALNRYWEALGAPPP